MSYEWHQTAKKALEGQASEIRYLETVNKFGILVDYDIGR